MADQQQNTSGSPTSTTSNRRRSSGLMPAFDSLHEQKRGNEANTVRRQSLSDQNLKGGMFSQFFHSHFGRDATK